MNKTDKVMRTYIGPRSLHTRNQTVTTVHVPSPTQTFLIHNQKYLNLAFD